jgi:hypothetical protein
MIYGGSGFRKGFLPCQNLIVLCIYSNYAGPKVVSESSCDAYYINTVKILYLSILILIPTVPAILMKTRNRVRRLQSKPNNRSK